MNTAEKVAEYIIKSFHIREDLITNLKLQKLLYYVQGWHLGVYGTPAFQEELQAWVHGPVQPEIYQKYKKYAWNPINEAMPEVTFEAKMKNHIDEVLEEYGGETGWQLERMTHREEPWIEARRGLPEDAESTAVITKDSMKNYFQRVANVKQ